MITKALKTRTFQEGEDLISFVTDYIRRIPENSVILITSKIVALAEKRTVVIKNSTTKE